MLTFMGNMKRVVNSFVKERNRRMSRYELTSSQVDVLIYLLRCQDKNEINQIEIQHGLALSCPTVNGILERLKQKGFIRFEKSKIDLRRKNIILTEKGYDTDTVLFNFGPEWERAAVAGFSEDEIEMLIQLMRRLEENVKKMMNE